MSTLIRLHKIRKGWAGKACKFHKLEEREVQVEVDTNNGPNPAVKIETLQCKICNRVDLSVKIGEGPVHTSVLGEL